MQNCVYVLCYHRILADPHCAASRPYVRRGIAVSEAVFREHVRDITESFQCLDEAEALAAIHGDLHLNRPGCWITFDDGYVDVAGIAASVLGEAYIPATVFITTGVLDGMTLPADRWYTVLASATRRAGTLRGPQGVDFDLDDDQSYSRLVDGPERRSFLTASRERQDAILCDLANDLVAATTVPQDRIYLDVSEVTMLARIGWTVGSHSVSHSILPRLDEREQRRELLESRSRIAEILGVPPRVFAYPDGQLEAETPVRVREAGYAGAVTIVPRYAAPGQPTYELPRFIVPNDPAFIRSLRSGG